MGQEDLKQKAIKGVFWSFFERFGSLIILFIANIVLARILSPEEFGLIGVLMAFILFFNILIDGGFGNALIQRKSLTNTDCSTIFYINIGISLICYLTLLFGAESIVSFFNQPADSALILQILGAVVVIDALGAVQNNILIRNLNFRKITFIKTSVALISSIAAIISGYCGLGVWSLAVQYILNSVLKSIFLWIGSEWHPTLNFSKKSFRELFGFGSNILIANVLSEGYRNFQVLIIGKFFPAAEVGYYTQAKHLQDVPVTGILSIINQVTFPVFARLQDDISQLVGGIRRCIKILTFINFPMMICMIIVAEPLFIFLFGDKWVPAVPFFQWLCGGFGMLLVIHNTNLNVIKAIGRSDIMLYLEITKKVLGLLLIFLFLYLGAGVIGILWAITINSVAEFFLNGYFTGKYTGYGIIQQAKDILPNLLIATLTGAATYFITSLIPVHYIATLFIQILLYMLLYFAVMKISGNETLNYIAAEIKAKIKK